MNKTEEQTKTAKFQPGDKVRFINGYEKAFIGDGVFTVKETKDHGDRIVVKLEGVGPKFSQEALEKANTEIMDVDTMFQSIEYCFTEETCLKCPLAGERESCSKKWQEALKEYKEQVEKDILAYKTELAIFNTMAQQIIMLNDCSTCYINKKCPIKDQVEKTKERVFEYCLCAHRAVYAAFYESHPDNLKKELSGYIYKEDGGEGND